MLSNNIPSDKYFFHHEDKQIEFIKNEIRSPESFVLKVESNTSESSRKAGKVVKFLSPVVSLALSVFTVSGLGFSFLNSGIMDKIQFLLISLFFAGVYLVPIAVALVIMAGLVSVIIDGRKNMSEKFSCFVEISEEVQEYLKFFNAEKIYEYSKIQEEASQKEEELKDFQKLVKKARKDFSLRNEAESRIEKLKKELEILKDMADQILIDEMNSIVKAEEEKRIREEVDSLLEVEALVRLDRSKKEAKEAEVESKILYELANDETKDISERNAI